MYLEKLNLVTLPQRSNDRFQNAREALERNLAAQLKAAKAMVEGKPSELSDRQKWYFKTDGKTYFKVKVSGAVIPLGGTSRKPLLAVEVGEDKNLPDVIEAIQKAVQAGELDDTIRNRLEERAAKRKSK